MKLLTKELEKRFEKIGSQEGSENPIVIARYFCPWNNWNWYATEYNSETKVFFGYVIGFEKEWGYFSLEELGQMGIKIERDLYCGEKPLSDIVKK